MAGDEENDLSTEREAREARNRRCDERLASLLAEREGTLEVEQRRERVEGVEDDKRGGSSFDEPLYHFEGFFAAPGL